MENSSSTSPTETATTETFSQADVITLKIIFGGCCRKIYTQSYKTETWIGELKSLLENVFNIPGDCMRLTLGDEELEDDLLLKDLIEQPFGVLELNLKSTCEDNQIDLHSYEDYVIPDVLTVRVQTEEEGIRDVVVEVEDKSIIKPFLGGFIDQESGLEYHHGYSQTGPPRPKVPPERKTHRDTQTYFTRNRKLEMEYGQATQMSNTQTWIPTITDKILTAGKYETADEREKRLDVEGKTKTIQRYFRAWKMRNALRELSFEYHKRLRLMLEREERERKEDLARRKKDVISRAFPRTEADFSMLYAMTERWKKAEIMRIVSMHCGPARIAEFYLLLEKEIEILRSIEALRLKMRKDRKIQKEIEFFKIIGDTIKWNSSYKNLPCEMDSLETQKGRVYRDLYLSVSDKKLDPPGRIDVLMNLRKIMESHNCLLSNELIELIDRTCELLARGFTDKEVEGLEMRIEALLLHHFELTECNEGVTDRHNRLTEKSMKENLFYCQNCHRLKPLESFNVTIRDNTAKVCATCKFIDKSKDPWMDISPYRFILRQIRRNERLLHSYSSVVFILQDKDVFYIVTNIWHAHSALSECDDVYQLRLCRWDKNNDWSPWNCILLTVEEAKAHSKIKKLEDVYDENFLSHVRSRHALAKNYFGQSLEVEKCVKKSETTDIYATNPKKEKCLYIDYQ